MEIGFNEVEHQYLVNGEVVPSVTQILKTMGVSSIEGIPPEVLERARMFGSVVHKHCEIVDLDKEDGFEPPPAEVIPCLMAWEQFKEDFKVKVIDVEKRFYNEKGRYCGTIDRRAMVNGVQTILDIKTSSSFNPSYAVQLAAYKTDEDKDVMTVHLFTDGTYTVYGTQKFGKQRKVWIDLAEAQKDWENTLNLFDKFRRKGTK